MFTGKNYWRRFGTCVVVAVIAVCATADDLIVDNGKSVASIVLSSHCTAQAQRAAGELQRYLERISGAQLPIISDDAAPPEFALYVGRSQQSDAAGIQIPSGFTHQMAEEGYVIQTIPQGVILAGNEDGLYLGTLYAVYDFLERLGCRWYFPGTYGEVVPAQKTIAIGPIHVVERPDFRFRNIWYSGWMPVSEPQSQDFALWRERNRMNSLVGLSLPGDGSVSRLAPADQYFDSHPNIYAVDEKGNRMKDMLCLSEPEAVTIAVKTITEEFRAHPEQWTFGFAPPDGHPRCHCARCVAAEPGFEGMGFGEPSLSDTWFKFANAVATEVYKAFPDHWIFTNGYANRVRPPEGVGTLSPNLGIQSALIQSCTFHRIGDPHCWQREVYKTLFDRWTRDLKCVFVYDYDPGKSLDNLPFPNLHTIAPDMRYYKERGIWGFWTEGSNNWMVTHLNYYLRAKLMWNTDANTKELVRDYCERFYGDAARPIEQYIWTLEDSVEQSGVHTTWGRLIPWQVILPPETMRKLDGLMARAAERSQGAGDTIQSRTHMFNLMHDHIRAFLAMEDCAARGDYANAVSHADKMKLIRDEAESTLPGMLPHTPEWARDHRGTLEWFRKTYQPLADQCNGEKGTRIAMFPSQWEFKTDPRGVGTLEEWYLPGKGGKWETISDSVYWDAQGYQDESGWPYAGKAWYRGAVDVPANAGDKPLRLTVAGVSSVRLWIWLNGQLVDHRMKQDAGTPFDIEVSKQVRPGQTNHLAVLVETLSADRTSRGGLHRRVFLWSPKNSDGAK
ncbi:MAG: DUF4838 domain-containing protein [Candidatus Hydrogenedentes bacterium]|nr:DUF4838 domain-containing protein [Candidatus Hydrogenedentota bacterium]